MLPSRKIFMGISGVALITLGVICIAEPVATVMSVTWLAGLLAIVSGICTFFNWASLRHYFPQRSSILVSAILQTVVGIVLLRHDLAVASILPLLFAFFLIFEGINLAARSFDYRMIRFKFWWVNLILGILSSLLGVLSLTTPGVGGATLSLFIGLGFIAAGAVYLIALFAVNRFEKRLNDNPWIDEQ